MQLAQTGNLMLNRLCCILTMFLISSIGTASAVWLPGNSQFPEPYVESNNLRVEMLDDYGCEITFTIPGLELGDTENGYKLLFGGALSTGAEPLISGFLSMPAVSDIAAEVISCREQTYPLENATLNYPQFGEASEHLIYFESGVISLGRPGIMRDLRLAPVAIRPYRIDRQANTISVTAEITIRFTFPPGETVNPKTVFRPESHAFKGLYRSLAWNYVDNGLDDFTPSNYLIVCPDYLANEMQALYQWKNQRGVRTSIVTFSEINPNPEDPYVIKNYIDYVYHNSAYPPDYVLLVGDANNFPLNYEYTDDPPTPFSYYSLPGNYINDNYFACLEGDDYFPDVFYGRFCATTELHALQLSNKIISYEQNPNLIQQDWYTQGIVCSDQSEYTQRTTKLTVRNIMLEDGGFDSVDTLFVTGQPSLFISWVNNGRSFVNYRGAGWSSGWSGISVNIGDLSNLNNYFKLPVVTGIGCGAAKFDDNCFGEAWMNAGTMSNHCGSIAFIGPTWNTHTNYNNTLDQGLYEALWQDSLRSLGPAQNAGKMYTHAQFSPYISAYPSVDEIVYVLFGQYVLLSDPEFLARAAPPQAITVSHPDSVLLGQGTVEVVVTDDGDNPMEGLLVGAFIDGEVFAADLTDGSGIAHLEVNPQSRPNQLKIAVSGLDIATYSDSIPVYSNSQFVSLYQYSFDDLGGDGMLSPGETGELSIQAKNYGTAPANGVWGVLSSSESEVLFDTDSVFFGDITPDEELWGEEPFRFSLQVGYNPPTLPLTVTFHDEDGYSWTSSLSLYVHHLFVVFIEYSVDPGPDGLLERGGEAGVTVTVHNIGYITALNMVGTLESLDPEVVIIDGEADYHDIEQDEMVTNDEDPFVFLVTDFCPSEFLAHFRFTLSGDQGSYNYSIEEEFEFVVCDPSMPDPGTDDMELYYAYEERDVAYNQAPVYEWTEISPYEGGGGTEVFFADDAQVSLVELPFNWIYYDEEYSRLTISADGFIAPDSISYTISQNWGIPRPDAVPGIVAAMWKDLHCLVSEPGDVSYLHNPADGSFRVEYHDWSHGNSNIIMETFQIVIYDPEIWVTQSGNSVMEFIYEDVTDYGLFYSTCGIESPSERDGIEIWEDQNYPNTTWPPLPYTTIRFTTEPPQLLGVSGRQGVELQLPETIFLDENYPNPFNPVTNFRFGLPRRSHVNIAVYNILGRKVTTLIDGIREAGVYRVQWDACGNATGLYFVRLSMGEDFRTIKCLLVK